MLALRPHSSLRQLSRLILTRWSSTTAKATENIETLLSQPSWSVKTLLPSSVSSSSSETTVTPKQLHHLLRLSALPQPSSNEEEVRMLKTLQSQLHFVREMQSVDATGVAPLRAIRDETGAADQERTIGIDSLKDALTKEELVGTFHKRIRRSAGEKDDSDQAEKWEPLEYAERKAGDYFIVENEKA